MDKPSYQYKTSANGYYYYFESAGKTTIPKVVGYILRDKDLDVVELIFGDLVKNKRIDVLSVSDNEDLSLVISTVIHTLSDFLERFPKKTVYFQGSTPSRTRLYRAVIAKNLEENELFYEIFGILENEEFEIFDKNHTYYGYIIKKKT